MVDRQTGAAAQDVSAAEHARLRHEYAALRDRFEAADEVLSAMGRSAGDPDTVLTTVVESARRLCRCDAVHVYLIEDQHYHLTATVGLGEDARRFLSESPIAVDRGTLIGRVALDRTTQQITDVLDDPDYQLHTLQRLAGYRTLLAAPMLLDGEVVGAINLWRNEVRPFDEREEVIVSAFAVQAAMAVNGVKLVQQLEARGQELARRVEQLEALGEVSEAVSSSLDVDHVLSTIAKHAVELSGTDGGSIMEYDEHERCFRVRSVYRTEAAVVEQLRRIRIDVDGTLVGRATRQGTPITVADLGAAPLDAHLRILHDAGWRSVVAVPMLRDDRIVGCLLVRRKRTGDFSEDTVGLLETFANQSALAMLNAQLYGELKEQSSALERASRHKSEFLASMSHELRTPLNAVLGFSEVLLEQMFGEINERQEEYLHDIHSSGAHLLELLNEILDLSKVEAGRMVLEMSDFDLRVLLENAASMLRDRATAHDIDLRVVTEDGVSSITSDELRLKQVVLNLLTNAVKFTPDGGSVTLRAARTPAGVDITVTDTGIGVPEEDRERIFESFQQGGRGSTREEGTGLGLTLSRRIVDLFGGRMWLETGVGVGSTFGFSLPLPDGVAAQVAVAPENPAAVHDVVVIEDDRPSLDLLTAYLSGADLRVTAARDGQSGLDAVRRVRPVAVLLDIRLPGVDGWAVLRALKEDPATQDIPVVVVSIVDERARGVAMGAAAYLVKPVRRRDVLSALAGVGAPVPAGRAVAAASEEPEGGTS